MNKEGRFQNVLIILLAVAVVGMSIGFAALQTQLTINGNATFQAAKWKVIWDNTTLQETEVNGTNGTAVINNNNLNIDYTVTLKPNSSYSFTVNAKNEGTFDAKLNRITFLHNSPADVTNTYGTKIGYTFTYNGVAYTETTDLTAKDIKLPKNGGTVPVVVTLTYPLPGDESQLLTNETTLELGVQLDYVPIVENN